MTKDSIVSWFQNVIAVVIAMVSFWMIEARYYITREEASEMIKIQIFQSPYSQDKNLIFDSLNNQKINNDNLVKALKENTDAINQLRVNVAIIANKVDK